MIRIISRKLGQRSLRKSTKELLALINSAEKSDLVSASTPARRHYRDFVEEFGSELGFLTASDQDKNNYLQNLQSKAQMSSAHGNILDGKSRGASVVLQYVLCLSFGLKSETAQLYEVLERLKSIEEENADALGLTDEQKKLLKRTDWMFGA